MLNVPSTGIEHMNLNLDFEFIHSLADVRQADEPLNLQYSFSRSRSNITAHISWEHPYYSSPSSSSSSVGYRIVWGPSGGSEASPTLTKVLPGVSVTLPPFWRMNWKQYFWIKVELFNSKLIFENRELPCCTCVTWHSHVSMDAGRNCWSDRRACLLVAFTDVHACL